MTEDEFLEAVARMRVALDSGKSYSLEEVEAEFGAQEEPKP